MSFRGWRSCSSPYDRLREEQQRKSAAARLPRLLLGGLECSDERLLPLEVRGLKYGGRFVDIVHGRFFRRPTFRVHACHGGERLDLSATLYSPGALAADKPPRIWSYRDAGARKDRHPPADSGEVRAPFSRPAPGGRPLGSVAECGVRAVGRDGPPGSMRADIQPSYVEEQPARFGLDGRQVPQWPRRRGADGRGGEHGSRPIWKVGDCRSRKAMRASPCVSE